MLSFPEQSSTIAASPDTLLEAFKRLETLLPKLIPSVGSKVHKIQGDGGAGTIVEYVYAPEFAQGRTLKMTTEVFDEVNHVFHFDLQLEGDSRYSSFKLLVQLFPGLLDGTTRSQWTFIYEPENAPPPLDIIATAHPCIVALSTYLHEFQSSSSSGAESAESRLAEVTIPFVSTEPAESLSETIPSAGTEPAESAESRLAEVTIPFVSTEPAESLSETIPSAGTEPAESAESRLAEVTIPFVSTEPAESLSETIPSVSTKAVESLDGTIPSASTEVAESYRNNPSACGHQTG